MGRIDLSSLQNIASDNKVSIGAIAKGVILAYFVTLIVFLVFAILITYTNFPESAIPTVVIVTTILSIIIGGIRVAKKVKSKGWLNGAITGFAYMLILYIISSLAITGFVFDKYVVYMMFLGLFTGAFGGIIGINLKGKGMRMKK
ncbi:MAG: TIGR04086 family membrane protein [Clostridiaceae bacterium]|nr:TIGR04086 family membrane protein [Clostridiaceae bacterium]